MEEIIGDNMYIIVAGAGMVGRNVIKELVQRGHDVVAIDQNKEVCEKISTTTGAQVLHGDASELGVLRDAGIDRSDVCIGLIGKDSANLAFTILSEGFDVPNILVRMKNPSYKDAYLRAGANKIINMVELYRDNLLMEIEHPSMKRVARLGEGKASIVIVEIPEDSPAEAMSIAEITKKDKFPKNTVFAGIFREDDFIVPRGDERIQENDRVFLSGDSESIRQASEFLGVK